MFVGLARVVDDEVRASAPALVQHRLKALNLPFVVTVVGAGKDVFGLWIGIGRV
jgi:hypothetical protein